MSTLQLAVQMELDGEQYYLQQAEAFSGLPVSKVFKFLAKAEQKHAALIKNFAEGQELNLADDDLKSVKHVFSNLAPYQTKAESMPRQLDIYRFAMDLEQKSITLYKKLKDETEQANEKKLLDFLIEQEEEHYALFETLTEMVQRPVDWVEDAEFGNREDY